MQLPVPIGLVTLLSDFGSSDPYVGIMKGMVKRQHAQAELLDLCHHVPPQDVAVGAFYLASAIGRFPLGTVHVAVVDPGVGTARRCLVACAHGCYWLAPDNGLLDAVLAAAAPHELRAADLPALQLVPRSATFHGRDVFAPLAGMLSSRRYGFRALGAPIDDRVRLPAPPAGDRVLLVDHFGNLVTTIRAADVGEHRELEIKGRRVALRRTYGDVAAGEALALINSYGVVEIAVHRGRAEQVLVCTVGEAVRLV